MIQMNDGIVLLHDINGDFRGYTLLKGDKLSSTNIWPEQEIQDLLLQAKRLNDDVNIRQFWPNTRDPEVQALLNDSSFMPYETTTEQVVDDENSYYRWSAYDGQGNPAPGAVLDRDASVLTYKAQVVPVHPEEVTLRFKRAHEIVARRRAGLDEGEALQYDGHGNYVSADDPNG